jgi:DNA-binding Lrp family transcriptional regulator
LLVKNHTRWHLNRQSPFRLEFPIGEAGIALKSSRVIPTVKIRINECTVIGMDETDIRLCQMLFANSRMSVRDLADRLEISIQATHRRMQNLKSAGVIHRYISFLSVEYLRTGRVYASGRTDIKDYQELRRLLRENDMVYVVLVAGEDFLNISFIPRGMNDLDAIATFLKSKIRISNPLISIESQVCFGDLILNRSYTGPPELSAVDYRILHALQENSRKGIDEIAEDLSLSARTVTRHLDRMIEDGAIEFGLDWDPAYSSGITSLIMVKAKPGVNLGKIRSKLNESFGGKIIFTTSFVNLLDILGCYSWTPTSKGRKQLVDEIGQIEGVEQTQSVLLQDGWVQETWRDRMLRDKAEAGK